MQEKNRTSSYRFMCCIMAVALLLLLLMTYFAKISYAIEINKVKDYKDAKNGVVRLVAFDENKKPLWHGSGFGIGVTGNETDVFVTNRHVIWDEDTRKPVSHLYIPLDDDTIVKGKTGYSIEWDRMIECSVLYPTKSTDPEYPDYAIIKAEKIVPGRIALPLQRADEIPDGSKVFSIGYPGSADRVLNGKTYYRGSIGASSIADGIISRRLRLAETNDTYLLSHTAKMTGGNSGGPLVAESGVVIGINTYGIDYQKDIYDNNGNFIGREDTGIEEYNLSVYIDYAMNKLDELGIEYDMYKPLNITLIIAISAGAVAIVVILIVLLKNAKKKLQPVPKEYRLQCISGIYAGRRFPIKGVVKLGRLKDNNDLIFPDGIGVSGMHCQLKEENDTVYLIDLNSRNGTWVNGEKLQPGEPRELKEGDSFCIGKNREGKITEGFRIDVNKVT